MARQYTARQKYIIKSKAIKAGKDKIFAENVKEYGYEGYRFSPIMREAFSSNSDEARFVREMRHITVSPNKRF